MKENDKTLRIGVIGTGRIANRFVPEIRCVKGGKVNGIYNPHLDSAKQFAKRHELNFYTNSVEDLLDKADAIYIASPHDTHFGYIKDALIHKKHVLCEKPMVLKKEQAAMLYALAKEKNCVLMEGIKTAYCPGFIQLLQTARSGKIGDIRDVEACFTKLTKPELREMTDTATGGSFTELASYTILAIFKLLGTQYRKIRFESFSTQSGVDIYTKAYLKYEGSFATSKTGLGVKSEGQLLISGTKGYIRVDAPWWKTQSFEVCYEDVSQNEKFITEFLGDGLRYEINDFICAINGWDHDKWNFTAGESIALAGVMEKYLGKR